MTDLVPVTPAADPAAIRALLERSSSENFPVASRVLAPEIRGHLLAVYGFARLVDHVGDESPGDRCAQLDWLDEDLTRLYAAGDARHPLVRALGPTVQRFAIPEAPLRALVEANRRDQSVTRYDTFDDLLAYCALSANPVGHLVLAVFEAVTPQHVRWSDRICTGLQLAEHWQDVAEDADAGRIYLPAEDMDRFGVTEQDLTDRRVTGAFRRLMRFEVARAGSLLNDGRALVTALDGAAKLAVAAFLAGGKSALRAIEQAGGDVLTETPRPGRVLRARMLARTLWHSGAWDRP